MKEAVVAEKKTTSTINTTATTPGVVTSGTTTKDKKKKSKGQAAAHSNFLLQGPLANLMDHRTYFKNKEDPPAPSSDKKDGSVTALKQWFESLSV